jgi:crossover junction endodeoxyribonuclease RuvC
MTINPPYNILGIDPSLRGTGFGVIAVLGGGRMEYLYSATLHIKGCYTTLDCLHDIALEAEKIAAQYQIEAVAVEEIPYVQNVEVLKKLAMAEGAAILGATKRAGVKLYTFPPTQIKKSATGFGKADKGCVQRWVRGILGLDFKPDSDSADALAAAITLANKTQNQLIPQKLKSM